MKKMLMSAERSIKRLARLAPKIDPKDLAGWMIQGDKLGQCNAGDAGYVSDWIHDVYMLGIRHYEHSKPHSVCLVCGKDSRRFDKRKHTRYCSDKCRQKAYRQRNGSGHRPRKQTVTP